MSIALRSGAGGVDGAIQINGVDKLVVNSDGSLVASVDPATGARTKALATMQKFADEFPGLLNANGYQKLPNGLILQWGSLAVVNNTATAFSFNTTFPNACFSITFSQKSSDSASVFTLDILALSASGATIYTGRTVGASNNLTAYWWAVGN